MLATVSTLFRNSRQTRAAGFTLLELAVVMFILALLLSSLLVPLGTQVDQSNINTTQKSLDDIKEALIGFALANGRLPCPASSTSAGAESYVGAVGASACTNNYDGFVPAVTLGVSPTDNQGYAVDAWGNRIRYAATTSNSNAFTTSNGMNTTGMSALAPDLRVCSTSIGITGAAPNTNCATANTLVNSAPAVVYSLGKNGASGAASADETENLSAHRTFVSRTITATGATATEFDDIVIWISPNILLNRMVAAGKLP